MSDMGKKKKRVSSSSGRGKQKKSPEQKKKEKLEQDGKEIYDSLPKSDCPVMIPPAPNLSPYVDQYEERAELSKSNLGSKQRQQDYEAEVRVYRALERLNEEIIVIHGLQYTRGEYKLFVGEHSSKKKVGEMCKMKDKETEEECDFVVIGDNYFVVIEVKNVSHSSDADEALSKAFKDSIDQRRRTVELIHGINEDVIVYDFIAYPNFSKQYRSRIGANEEQMSAIIFKEDLEDFSTWWIAKTQLQNAATSCFQREKHVLIALWCTDKNKCDKEKCSLGRATNNIDESLRSGNFTFKSKNRDPNPGVASDTPDIIKKFVGVNNLTVEQLAILKSKQNLLWINGPAGSGKTVIMCGKMLELALSGENKIVVFTFVVPYFNYSKSNLYERALENAGQGDNYLTLGIECQYYCVTATCDKLSQACQLNGIKVIFVELDLGMGCNSIFLKNIVASLKDCHIFIDDLQCLDGPLFLGYDSIRKFVGTLRDQSHSRTVWVAYDMVQGKYIYLFNCTMIEIFCLVLDEHLLCEERVTLSKNLRNTFDLSSILSVIRNLFIESYGNKIKLPQGERSCLNRILPKQGFGHFIHGPSIVIHVLTERDEVLLGKIFKQELGKLCTAKDLDSHSADKRDGCFYTNIAIVSSESSGKNCWPNEIKSCPGPYSYSKEWPAVIVLQEMHRDVTENAQNEGIIDRTQDDLRILYLAISRARVKCSLVIYPEEGADCYSELTLELPRRLEPLARVTRH